MHLSMGKLQGKSFQLAFRSGEASITGKVRKEDNKEERNNAKTKEGKLKNRKERRDKERRREQGTKGNEQKGQDKERRKEKVCQRKTLSQRSWHDSCDICNHRKFKDALSTRFLTGLLLADD